MIESLLNGFLEDQWKNNYKFENKNNEWNKDGLKLSQTDLTPRDRRRSARFVLTSPRNTDEITSLQFKIWKFQHDLMKMQMDFFKKNSNLKAI